MEIYVRLDEQDKTNKQIKQREQTYLAAKILRQNGFKCSVREFFTGKSVSADAAAVILEQE